MSNCDRTRKNTGHLLRLQWMKAWELVPVPVLLLVSMGDCGSRLMAHRLASQCTLSPGQIYEG